MVIAADRVGRTGVSDGSAGLSRRPTGKARMNATTMIFVTSPPEIAPSVCFAQYCTVRRRKSDRGHGNRYEEYLHTPASLARGADAVALRPPPRIHTQLNCTIDASTTRPLHEPPTVRSSSARAIHAKNSAKTAWRMVAVFQ